MLVSERHAAPSSPAVAGLGLRSVPAFPGFASFVSVSATPFGAIPRALSDSSRLVICAPPDSPASSLSARASLARLILSRCSVSVYSAPSITFPVQMVMSSA